MESVLKADNERQAAEKTAIAEATLASGEKNAAIQRAEGQKQAAILQAEGQKTATIAIAEGDAQATRLRNEALTTYFKDSAIVFKQLETIAASLQNNTKIIVPEGKAISLILNEQENLSKATIIPIPPPPTEKQQTNVDKTRNSTGLHRFCGVEPNPLSFFHDQTPTVSEAASKLKALISWISLSCFFEFAADGFNHEAGGVILVFDVVFDAFLDVFTHYAYNATSSPVSSLTSRTMVCSIFSPGSILPPGNAQ